MHYGATPPPGARVIEQPRSPPATPPSRQAPPGATADDAAPAAQPKPGTADHWKLREQEFRQRRVEQETESAASAKQNAEREQKRKAACASLADDLDRGGRTRWYRMNDKGEREFYTDAEIDQYIKEMEQSCERHCRR